VQDYDPSKNPSASPSSSPKSKTRLAASKTPKATAKEARELLALAMSNLYQTTTDCRALEARLRDVLAENRELRAALAEKVGR
jgi:hypothetical protein